MLSNLVIGAGELAPRYRELAALQRTQIQASATKQWLISMCNPRSGISDAFFYTFRHQVHAQYTYIYMQA